MTQMDQRRKSKRILHLQFVFDFRSLQSIHSNNPNQMLRNSSKLLRGHILQINLLVFISITDTTHSFLQHRYTSVKFLELGTRDSILFGFCMDYFSLYALANKSVHTCLCQQSSKHRVGRYCTNLDRGRAP